MLQFPTTSLSNSRSATKLSNLQRCPFYQSLKKVLKACGKYWEKHDKANEFFKNATRLASGSDIYALKVGDFGTTGVDGSDSDISSRWFGLVKSGGVSNQKGC